MGRKPLPPNPEDKDIPAPDFVEVRSAPRLSGFLQQAFNITKFALGLFLVPFVYAITRSFLEEVNGKIPCDQASFFWYGIVSFLLMHHFIYAGAGFYARGQKILEALFSFFKPLVKVAPYVLPVYSIMLFLVCWPLSLVLKGVVPVFLSLFGFFLALHLVFSARTMRSKQGDLLRANYLFGFSVVFILNIFAAGFCFNFFFDRFSLISFANRTVQIGAAILRVVFLQLFVNA